MSAGQIIDVTITPAEIAKFKSVIDEMIKRQNTTIEKVCRNMARDVARAALSKTKSAPKFATKEMTKGINNQEYKKRFEANAGGDVPYAVTTKHKYTGQTVTFPGTADEAENYGGGTKVPVKHRGFLKSGWAAVLYKLGVGRGANYLESDKWGQIMQGGTANTFQMTLVNEVPFVSQWDAGRNRWGTPQRVVEESIRDTTVFWERILHRYVDEVAIPKGSFRSLTRADEYARKAQMKIPGENNDN